MQKRFLLVREILQPADVLDGTTERLDAVSDLLDETLAALARGEIG